jgi:hypothetical protein
MQERKQASKHAGKQGKQAGKQARKHADKHAEQAAKRWRQARCDCALQMHCSGTSLATSVARSGVDLISVAEESADGTR